MSNWNLPNGTTTRDIDRHFGGEEYDHEGEARTSVIHNSKYCACDMCRWADATERRHAAEKVAEQERAVINAS